MTQFSQRFRRIRKEHKMTQMELSKVSGVSQQGISNIEKGIHSPTEATVRMLAKGLGVTVSELLGEDDQNEKEPAPEQSRQDLMESIGEMFRQLPPDQQAEMIGYLRGLAAASSQKR